MTFQPSLTTDGCRKVSWTAFRHVSSLIFQPILIADGVEVDVHEDDAHEEDVHEVDVHGPLDYWAMGMNGHVCSEQERQTASDISAP